MARGLVIKSTGSWYKVRTDDNNFINCKIKGKFRVSGIDTTNPVVVGDNVEYDILEKEGIGIIKKIHKRKNYIIRRSINLSKQAHIIASNIDQAFLIITLVLPEIKSQFIDRFLVCAEAYSIPVKLVFNKSDLYNQKQLSRVKKFKNIYEDIGYECFIISSLKKENTKIITDLCKNKISLFAGNSGVGKSTLINILDPGLNLKTKELSKFHLKGRHTTTFSEMVEIKSGGYIIDTPGIKGFGLVDIGKEELYHYFPEIFRMAKNCKYNNCSHIHEPGCAVIEAVDKDVINISRYENYINMYNDEDNKYRLSIKSGK